MVYLWGARACVLRACVRAKLYKYKIYALSFFLFFSFLPLSFHPFFSLLVLLECVLALHDMHPLPSASRALLPAAAGHVCIHAGA